MFIYCNIYTKGVREGHLNINYFIFYFRYGWVRIWTPFSISGDEILVCLILKYISTHFQSRFMMFENISVMSLNLLLFDYMLSHCITKLLLSFIPTRTVSVSIPAVFELAIFFYYLVLSTHILWYGHVSGFFLPDDCGRYLYQSMVCFLRGVDVSFTRWSFDLSVWSCTKCSQR